MALISKLMVRIGVDESRVGRGVQRAQREFTQFGDNVRRMAPEFGESGEQAGRQFGEGFTRDARGRLHDSLGRFVREGQTLGRNTGGGFSIGFGGILKKFVGKLPGIFKAAAPAAAVGSGLITAIPLIVSAASWIGRIGGAAISAAPALLGLAAAGMIVKKSFGAIFAEGSAARKALSGLNEMFNKAAEAGSRAAAKGVKPLVDRLRRLAQPTVTKFMEGLGRAANRVQRDFLKWASSAEGLRAIKSILGPISASFEGLAPHISKLVISFVNMLGRIMGVSTALGKKGLAGAIDWLSEKMDKVNAASVADGLATLADVGQKVMKVIKTVVTWVKMFYKAYKTYTTQFKLLADALAIVAIIFGGPIVTAVAAVGLLIRHFDKLKAAWTKLKDAFTGKSGGPIAGAFANLKKAGATVLPALKSAFEQIKSTVLPILKEIADKLVNDLFPAVAAFAEAMSPIVAFLVRTLGPVVANTLGNLLNIIKGVLDVIIGIFKVFTGLLKGDWSLLWEGLVQIVSGLGGIVVAAIKQAWEMIKLPFVLGTAIVKSLVTNAWTAISSSTSNTWNAIKSFFSNAWKGMLALVSNVVTGIKVTVGNGFNAAKTLVSNAINGAKSIFSNAWKGMKVSASSGVSAVVGLVRSLPGRIRSAIGNVGSLLYNAGRNVVQGLINGINAMVGRVASAISRVTSTIRNHLPFSPAKEGPLSGRGNPELSGMKIASMVADGMLSGTRRVASAAGVMTAATGLGGGSYGTPSGVRSAYRNGGRDPVLIGSDGSKVGDFLVEVLSQSIEDRGGDVQIVLGR